MKPIIIIPPDMIADEDIKLLRDNDICVVVSKNPAAVKFIDPIPAASNRTKIEDAAIRLSRKILNRGLYDDNVRGDFARLYVELLVQGTPLDPNPTQEEQERTIFDSAKRDELQRLARQEAKEERAAIKAAKTNKDLPK